jgi:hypothetical protein
MFLAAWQQLQEVMPQELSDVCQLTEGEIGEVDPQRFWATLLALGLAKVMRELKASSACVSKANQEETED